MEKRINIAELLKNAPKGTKLYSPLCGECELAEMGCGSITLKDTDGLLMHFFEEGNYRRNGECMIFPSKENRDWSTFQRPFNDGDIVFYNDTIAIFKEWGDETLFRTYVTKYLCCDSLIDTNVPLFGKSIRKEIRFATEKEKQKLFNAIKANGYKWNPETKTLDKLIKPEFKDGDILVSSLGNPFIFKKRNGYNNAVVHCALDCHGKIIFDNDNWTTIEDCRYATEEEKEKLFDAIKAKGYKWNEEKKVLEKSNSFYTGDVLVSRSGNIVLLSHVDNKQIIYYHCILEPFGGFRIPETPDCGVGNISDCYLASDEQRDRLFDKLKKSGYKYNPRANKLEKLPSFKVGNRIRSKISKQEYTIRDIKNNAYILYMDDEKFGYHINFDLECNFELVPNKFDITKLKTFDKVLVRCSDNGYWSPQFFSKFRLNSEFPFKCTHNSWKQCIPYEGNEHLSDTTNDCDDFYKIW